MIVVTGATGHVGNVLVRLLCRQGIKVKALVLPGDDVRLIEDTGAEKVEGDVRSPESLLGAFDVLRSNSLVSSKKAKAELGFTTRPWQDSIRDHYDWFRGQGMLTCRRN